MQNPEILVHFVGRTDQPDNSVVIPAGKLSTRLRSSKFRN